MLLGAKDGLVIPEGLFIPASSGTGSVEDTNQAESIPIQIKTIFVKARRLWNKHKKNCSVIIRIHKNNK